MMTVLLSDLSRRIHLGGTARSPDDVISLYKLGLQFAEITIAEPENFHLLQNEYRARSGKPVSTTFVMAQGKAIPMICIPWRRFIYQSCSGSFL